MRQRLKTVAAGVAVSLWGLGAAAGLFLLAHYERTPGPAAIAAPGAWPGGTPSRRTGTGRPWSCASTRNALAPAPA